MTSLETKRLLLRSWREGDLDAYFGMVSDPEVMRFIGDGSTYDRVGAWRSMAYLLGHWQLRGFGLWAVEEKATGRLVGRVGLNQPEGWPGHEVGWVLAREAWGLGYATEAGRASLDHAFDALGADHVISVIRPGNEASVRVAERLGETFEGNDRIGESPVLIYGVSRQAWTEEDRGR